MNILLVDDDAFLRDMYATKFGEHGHTVKVAESGERALALLGREKFDVVLLDMIMPGMSGIELLESIRKNESLVGIKCVVLSNQGEEKDIEAANELGVDGYIIKAELVPSEVVTKVMSIVS